MALIKCRECGKEISDQAAKCPHCGCPVQENRESCLENVENSEKQQEKGTKNKNKKIVVIVISILLVVLIAIVLTVALKKEEEPEEVSYQDKIDNITQFLGDEINRNESITVAPEILEFMQNAEMFGYYGVCSSGYSTGSVDDPMVTLDNADWTSKDEYSDKMFNDIVGQLTNIYGKGKQEEAATEEFTGEYVWKDKEKSALVYCGKNSDNKVVIQWKLSLGKDSTSDKPAKSDIKMFTEYEGKYDENAEQYKTAAEACFLQVLEEKKQSYIENGAAPENVQWELNGTFEESGNYFFCYTYSFSTDGVKSHVLIMYNVDKGEASEETPTDWLKADIEEAENRLNGN